ncbi:MarR family winged helix-turn-helix transcriptional regulator [Kaistia adipata]|uniref:MarR family winged helix-turn-helix transcriptional regulator n=1 Tax=Kaistia adipata TaxID=166954 RepID=UPI0004169904|nr:MarR family winged helix-turn-helix transcriptional regulator [Kaistia adipata]
MQVTLQRSRSAGYMTNWAARLFARAIDRRLKPLGISSGQLPVFFALGGGAALSQKALAELAAIEQPTMAATLSRMERDGLIEKSPDPDDRRSSLISLTPVALEKAQEVREVIASVNAAALSALSPGEQEAYLGSLAKITAALDSLED